MECGGHSHVENRYLVLEVGTGFEPVWQDLQS